MKSRCRYSRHIRSLNGQLPELRMRHAHRVGDADHRCPHQCAAPVRGRQGLAGYGLRPAGNHPVATIPISRHATAHHPIVSAFESEERKSVTHICSVADCTDSVHLRCWCVKHFFRWRRTGALTPSTPRIVNAGPGAIDACRRPGPYRSGWCRVRAARPGAKTLREAVRARRVAEASEGSSELLPGFRRLGRG